MNEKRSWMQRGHAIAWAVCAGAAASTVACAAAHGPTHVTEVPIDQFTTDGPAAPAPGTPSAAPDPAPVDPGASAAATAPATASPTPLPATDGAPAAPAAATSHPRPPPGQRLTPGDCTRMLDRFVLMLGTGQGLSTAQANKSLPQLRSQAQADPAYVEVQGSCIERYTKKQYQCVVKSTTTDGWKACLK